MTTLSIPSITEKGAKGTDVSARDTIFGKPLNQSLVHQFVNAYLAGARQGTKQNRSRADVSGGGIKPWRQKGTGRARAGSIRSPLWRSGGVTFAARNRDFSQKFNSKMLKAAYRSILSQLLREERLFVAKEIKIDEPKTKKLLEKLGQMKLDRVLIITYEDDSNLRLAARNLYDVDVKTVSKIDPVSLINFDKVLMTAEAHKQIEEWLGENKR